MLSHLRKASALLYFILGCHLACIASTKLPMIWNIQNSNEYFVGRKLLLDQLKQSLIIEQKQVIAVVGSAGIGKTQAAKKYAKNNIQYYDIVWWFDLEKNLDDQFKNLAENFNKINQVQELQVNMNGSPNEIVRQLKNSLALTKFKWLVVFDNVADKSEIVDYLPEKLSKDYGNILITSKNQLSWRNMTKLDKFSREESVKLLTDITGEMDVNNANKLAETLTDYPLAIVQAASFIKSHPGQSIKEYRELFLNNRNKLWKYENKNKEKLIALDNYKFTVSTVLSIMVERLKKESPNAFNLLAFCSFLGSKNIPDNLLKSYADNALKIDTLDYRNALSHLLKYSLLSQDNLKKSEEKNKKQNITFTMHELTQAVAHDLLKTNEGRKYIEQCLVIMAEFLPTKLDVLMPLMRQNSYLILHIDTMYKHAKQWLIYNNDLFTIKQRLLEYYLSGKRDYKIAQKTINEIEDFINKVNEPNSILKVRFFLMSSAFLAWQNIDHQKSLDGALHAFEILKNTTDCEEEYLMACNRLAQQYNLMGDNKNALKYAKVGDDLARKNPKLGNQDALFSNFTKIHIDNGNFEEALKYSEEMIAKLAHRQNKILPGPGNIPGYLIRCKVLIKAGKYLDAFKILDKIYYNLNDIFGTSDHVYKSTVEIYYAYVNFLIRNSTANSKNIILNANKKLCQLFGEPGKRKNLLLAQNYRFLGEIYESEANHIEALNNFVLALQTHYNHYESDKIATDDISDLYARLAIINVKLSDNIASQRYLDLHRCSFGYNHPRTRIITETMIDHGLNVRY